MGRNPQKVPGDFYVATGHEQMRKRRTKECFPSRREAAESLQGYACETVFQLYSRITTLRACAASCQPPRKSCGGLRLCAYADRSPYRRLPDELAVRGYSPPVPGPREPAPLRDGPQVSLRSPRATPPGGRTANAWNPLPVRTMGQTEGKNSRSH